MSEVVRNTIANKEAAVLMIDEGKPDGAMNVSFAVPKLEENKENNDDEEIEFKPKEISFLRNKIQEKICFPLVQFS